MSSLIRECATVAGVACTATTLLLLTTAHAAPASASSTDDEPARGAAPTSNSTPASTTAPTQATPAATAPTLTGVPAPGSPATTVPAPAAAATTPPPSAPPDGAARSCVEHIPEGKTRPEVIERFPQRGTSGHHAVLEVEVHHGLGERVLPGPLQIRADSDAVKGLEAIGFVVPNVEGPGRPRVMRREDGANVTTIVQLAFVPLPKEPGRHELSLPSLPIAMSRASGEVITLCTQPHDIVIEDPTTNEPNPKPKENPKPRRQMEFWEALRNAAYGGAAALTSGAFLFWLIRWYRRRPKPLPPPPPPRPPWEVAMEKFHDIRLARLIEQERYADHFDRVTHTLREYLGARFGFDGLESTTTEIMAHLRELPAASPVLDDVEHFLHESDLVRFADVDPTEAQCRGILDRSEQMVQKTIHHPPSAPTPEEVPTGGGT